MFLKGIFQKYYIIGWLIFWTYPRMLKKCTSPFHGTHIKCYIYLNISIIPKLF